MPILGTPSSLTNRKGEIPFPPDPAVGKAWRLTGDRRLAPTGRGSTTVVWRTLAPGIT